MGRATAPLRSAWSPGSCAAGASCGSGRTSWRPVRLRRFPVGDDALFVAYYASAEIGCFLALGWPVPTRILDLFTEFRARTNGLPTVSGAGLLGALVHFGLDAMGTTEKEDMRALILRGGPWSAAERAAILDYCAADVDALARLLPAMLPGILTRPHGLGHALLRGRYMAAPPPWRTRGFRSTPACWTGCATPGQRSRNI